MAPESERSPLNLNGIYEAFQPNLAFLVMIFGALVAFEFFNYSTTEHALADMLGKLDFGGIPWSTILALAFCGIDFAGIARLFTPETGTDEPKEVWYLFGAWLMAATMNAILTWWGVSMAVSNRTSLGSEVIDKETLVTVVPVFVAVLVWIIRILIIGTLSLAVDRLLHPELPGAVERRNATYHDGFEPRTSYQPKYSASPRSPVSATRAGDAQQRYRRQVGEAIYEDEDGIVHPRRPAANGSGYHSLSRSASPPGSSARKK